MAEVQLPPDADLGALSSAGGPVLRRLLVLDAVQDPGNLVRLRPTVPGYSLPTSRNHVRCALRHDRYRDAGVVNNKVNADSIPAWCAP